MGSAFVLWRVNLISLRAASTVGSPKDPTTFSGLWGAGGGGVLPSGTTKRSTHGDWIATIFTRVDHPGGWNSLRGSRAWRSIWGDSARGESFFSSGESNVVAATLGSCLMFLSMISRSISVICRFINSTWNHLDEVENVSFQLNSIVKAIELKIKLTVGLLFSVSEAWPDERPSSKTGMLRGGGRVAVVTSARSREEPSLSQLESQSVVSGDKVKFLEWPTAWPTSVSKSSVEPEILAGS